MHGLAVGVDAAIAEVAAAQHGRISRRQLAAIGVSDDAISHRVLTGRLHRLRRGLYAVGHRGETQNGRHRAAMLDVGPDALVSHLSSAADWKLRLPAPRVVDITSPRRLRSRPGIRLHCRSIDPEEIRSHHGLLLTSPSQTLFDLGTVLGSKALAKAANEAFVLRLATLEDLRGTLGRNANRKGATNFRRMLATLDPAGHRVRSPLETRLNAFLRARGFPPWESNVRLRIGDDVIEPDVLWRAQRVIVEADGRDPHLAPLTFASDRRRDRRLNAERWHPVRVTERDLGPGADELDRDLRTILGLHPPE